jgi:hypothetical protein
VRRRCAVAQIHPNWVPNATDVTGIPVTNGGSRPKVCEFDDKVRRIVKWQPSIYGQTATYSELVASRLGQLIDVPVLRGTIVYVEVGLLSASTGTPEKSGFHVGFTHLEGENFTINDFEGLNNRGAIPKAAVFLAWLNMGDHHDRNKYIRQFSREDPEGEIEKLKEFILIDMSEINGLNDWTKCGFSLQERDYPLPRQFRDKIRLEDALVVAEQIYNLEEDDITSCLEYYPDEWEINAEAVKRLAEFLLGRRAHLQGILNRSFAFQLGIG